jgi:hypothetical protein
LPLCAPQVLDREAQADSHGAAQVLGRGAGVKVVGRGAAHCALQVFNRGAQAVPRCALQVLGRGTQASTRGSAQVLDRCVQAAARGAARSLPRVPDFRAHAVARGAATSSQQEKNNSADIQRSTVNVTSFICSVVR